MDIIRRLASELEIRLGQAEAAVRLIDAGNTIPFIARYRKEATGSLNDEVLRNLDERLRYLRNLEERKQQVLASIEEQGGLTPEQTACIAKAAGICCVTQLAADVCSDAGESALSSAVMLCGKIALILLILPLFQPLLNRLQEVLSCISAFG